MRIALAVLVALVLGVPSLRAADAGKPELGVGAPAPDFSLSGLSIDPETGVATPDDKKPFRLTDHAGKKPVVLIFSSFT
jgi:hypothetical protein